MKLDTDTAIYTNLRVIEHCLEEMGDHSDTKWFSEEMRDQLVELNCAFKEFDMLFGEARGERNNL